MTITKAQEKLLQMPITLTLDQCLSICRHYESLKYHLEMIKPRSVEYLQKRHNKSKGHGYGHGGNLSQSTAKPGTGTGRGRGTPTTGSKCPSCGRYMVKMFAQLRIPFALVVTRKDILR